MSSQIISFLLQCFTFISDSIFIGAKFLAPLIFILKITNIKLKTPDLLQLAKALNILILTGGILFVLAILTNVFISLRYSNGFEVRFMLSMITGPHWYQLALPIFNFGILPNIFWMRRLRNSVYGSFFIVIFWLTSNFLVEYLTNTEKTMLSSDINHFKFNIVEYTEKAVIFITLIAVLYLIVNLKRKKLRKG